MALPGIAHLPGTHDTDLLGPDTRLTQDLASLGFHLIKQCVDVAPVDLGQTSKIGTDEIKRQRCRQKSDGRGNTGPERNDELRRSENLGNSEGVHRPGTTKGEDRVTARVLATFNCVDPGGAGHVLVDNLMNSPGGSMQAEPKWFSYLAHDGGFRPGNVQLHPATQEIARVEITQDKVGIRDRWRSPAVAVTDRSRVRAGRIRTNFEQSQCVYPGDRATTSADLDHLNNRDLDRKPRSLLETIDAADFKVRRCLRLAVVNQTGFGGRPAHVEREHVGPPGQPSVLGSGNRSRSRPGFNQANRVFAGGLDCRDTAGRQHDEQAAFKAELRQRLLQSREVRNDERTHIHIRDRRRGALVLADLRHNR